MIFYETDESTARIVEFIDDESYSALQAVLIADTQAGDLIPRTRGLLRFGGWVVDAASVVAFGVFTTWSAKTRFSCFTPTQMNREVDLSPRHLPMLRELVEQHLQTPTRMILHCFVRASAKRVRFGVVLRRSGR